MRQFNQGVIFTFLYFILTLLLSLGINFSLTNPNISVAQQVLSPTSLELNSFLELAKDFYREGQYLKAIELLENYLTEGGREEEVASRYLAASLVKVGQPGRAIQILERIIENYRKDDREESGGQLASLLVSLGRAYLNLGQTQKGISLLKEARDLASKINALETLITTESLLGNAYLLSGKLEQAIGTYESVLVSAGAQGLNDFIISLLNNLSIANSRLAEQYRREANWASDEKEKQEAQQLLELAEKAQQAGKKYARQAVELSRDLKLETLETSQALLNLMRLEPSSEFRDYYRRALAVLEKQPSSRSKAYHLINLSELAQDNKIEVLERAVAVAMAISDSRALSEAEGHLGKVYEDLRIYDLALSYTQQASLAAQRALAIDSLYRWQWQEARLHRARGNIESALAAYRRTIASWQKIREDIAAASRFLQFDFRDQVDPLYREFLELLLKEKKPSLTQEALKVLDLFQLAELEDFFGDDCLEGPLSEPREILAQTNAALIHSVILFDQTYLILQLPDGSVHQYSAAIAAQQLNQKLSQWRNSLEDFRSNKYLYLSKFFYDLLVRPMEADLRAANPSTLVFVHDGLLRNIPMAALHDGQQYLVEKYAIASSLGLEFGVSYQPMNRFSALSFGLSVAISPFPSLPNVAHETEQVTRILGGKRFLNEEFTWENVEEQVSENYSIIHLATHGKFGGSPKRTFLQAFDRRIALRELSNWTKLIVYF